MLTDLLVAGMMLASSPDLLPVGPAAGSTEPRIQARPGGVGCTGPELRAASQAALLEAHASYASVSPFSLARLGGAGAPAPAPSEAKGPGACAS